jgi:hypothetical protein
MLWRRETQKHLSTQFQQVCVESSRGGGGLCMATDEVGARFAWPPSLKGGGPAGWHACRLTRMPIRQKTSMWVQA